MDKEKRRRLEEKLGGNSRRLASEKLCSLKERISEEIPGFFDKYRFADDDECLRLKEFMEGLEYVSFNVPKTCGSLESDDMVWLCFLEGERTLFDVFIMGSYADMLADTDSFEVFSSRCIFTDDRFEKTVFYDSENF